MHTTAKAFLLGLAAPFAPAQDELETHGLVLPEAEVAVKARIDGYVGRVLVKPGDRVEEGAKLVEISAPELAAEVERAAAALAQEEVELEIHSVDLEIARKGLAIAEREVRVSSEELPKAKEMLDTCERDLRQAETLADAGRLSQRELSQSRTRFVEARAAWLHAGEQVKNAQDQVEIARLEVRRAEVAMERQRSRIEESRAALDAAKIHAAQADIRNMVPDATVVEVRASPGSLVVAGETPLLRLMALDRVRVVCDLPFDSLEQLKPGNPVRVSDGRRRVEAQITGIMATLDETTGTGRVEIVVDNGEGHWQPGVRVQVVFHPRK